MIAIQVTEGTNEIGVFLFGYVPRQGECLRLPAAKKEEKEREVIVTRVIHLGFATVSGGGTPRIGSNDPLIELRVDKAFTGVA
jgi:hypothetical protein